MRERHGMAQHERPGQGASDEWLTPPQLLRKLGAFDLDPSAPVNRPWDTAAHHYTIQDNGLTRPWFGRVWLNPPYGPQTAVWLRRLAEHGNGIALIFARTETRAFHRYVWRQADALLFLAGRLRFCDLAGQPSGNNAGAGSVLIAFGLANADALAASGLAGKFLPLPGSGAGINRVVELEGRA